MTAVNSLYFAFTFHKSNYYQFADFSEVVLLDVLLEERESIGGLSVVLDGAGRGTSDLSWDTLLVVLALSEPLTELLSGLNLDEWDFVLLGKGGDKLDVLGIIAVLGEDDKISILSVQSLTDLVETLHET